MKLMKVNGTEDTPHVILDPENQVINLAGRSLPEDVVGFYEPILNWVDDYVTKPTERTIVEFKFEYFSTASSKIILDIMQKLEGLVDEGKEVVIRWHYAVDDEDMQEAGRLYSDLVDIPFEHVEHESREDL